MIQTLKRWWAQRQLRALERRYHELHSALQHTQMEMAALGTEISCRRGTFPAGGTKR